MFLLCNYNWAFPSILQSKSFGSYILTFMTSLCGYWITAPLESLFYPSKFGPETLLHLVFLSSFLRWLRVLPGHWVTAAPGSASMGPDPQNRVIIQPPPPRMGHGCSAKLRSHRACLAAPAFLTSASFSTPIQTLKSAKLKQAGSAHAGRMQNLKIMMAARQNERKFWAVCQAFIIWYLLKGKMTWSQRGLNIGKNLCGASRISAMLKTKTWCGILIRTISDKENPKIKYFHAKKDKEIAVLTSLIM